MAGIIALSLIGVMCSIGVLLRRWIPLFRNYLVPATVIAGLIGLAVMNLGLGNLFDGVDAGFFGSITTELFTLTFISIGLTAAPKSAAGKKSVKASTGWRRLIPQSTLLRGAWIMGITWSMLFAMQELVGVGIVSALGPLFDMPAEYGLMAAFAFAQGPGQAATFGAIFAEQGWDDAVSVGLAFSTLGFLAAFIVGVPLAKYGIVKGLTRSSSEIDDTMKKGVYSREEQRESMGRVTTFSGSIESLGLAMSLVGVCYLGAVGISKLYALIPGFIGATMSGMMFMNGLFAAFILRWILGRLGAAHIINADLQRKITGLFSDFTVVAAFMAVQLAVVMNWIVPILVLAAGVAAVTLVICIFLGQHYGSDHDFERTLGMYGTATGTTPTGLALVRIVDPKLRTLTAAEMGLMNLPEMLYLPVMLIVSAIFAQGLGLSAGLVLICLFLLVYAVMAYFAGDFRSPTFRIFGKGHQKGRAGVGVDVPRLEGKLVSPAVCTSTEEY